MMTSANGNGKRRRNILLITTDQMRYDSLQCNGGKVARTPVANKLAEEGINYRRANNQNVVCMPARSSMITGQYVRTHGVYANGVPLPEDAPSIAGHLHEHGYRTALIGKAHFQPALDLGGRWIENRMAHENSTGPYRGFDYMELAMHGPQPMWHYGKWLAENHPAYVSGFYQLFTSKGLNDEPGGDTGAPEVKFNALPREYYHTDWVGERTSRWLDTLGADDPFFLWMSFPDPHHPWDPPEGELHRVNWRDLDLPDGHPGSVEKCEQILAQKPEHWLAYYQGRFRNVEGGPVRFVPKLMTHDQVREVSAMTHIQNELIDEACGRVIKRIEERGWGDNTDVFFTTDHGELQGDFGLLFKGPYHCDALMRIPMIWRPATLAHVAPSEVPDPVGQVDLAPTFCEIAGVPVPDWVQGRALPKTPGGGHQRMITEWDSQFPGYGMHLRTIYRDGFTCTVYERSTREPIGLTPDLVPLPKFRMPETDVFYEGTEGELYKHEDDPHQWYNLWNDPKYAAIRSDLIEDLYANLPDQRSPLLKVEAPT
jgi:arylsulfatase A-like enzyme